MVHTETIECEGKFESSEHPGILFMKGVAGSMTVKMYKAGAAVTADMRLRYSGMYRMGQCSHFQIHDAQMECGKTFTATSANGSHIISFLLTHMSHDKLKMSGTYETHHPHDQGTFELSQVASH